MQSSRALVMFVAERYRQEVARALGHALGEARVMDRGRSDAIPKMPAQHAAETSNAVEVALLGSRAHEQLLSRLFVIANSPYTFINAASTAFDASSGESKVPIVIIFPDRLITAAYRPDGRAYTPL
jgi:hypothetical protein